MPLASEDAKKFSRIVTQWRLMRGLSQQSLGEAIGHSQRHISFIENGRTKPSRLTVERLVDALAIPARDGNRLLNLLGFSGSLQDELASPPLDESGLAMIQEAWMKGMFPNPAYTIDERHRLEKMNLATALWLNRVAGIEEIYDDGRLSWPSLIFHPQGLRQFVEDWDVLATAYVQIVNREMLRNPAVGARLMNCIQRLFEVPSSWKSLNDQSMGTIGMRLRAQTRMGSVAVEFVILNVSAPPSQPGLAFLDFLVGSVIPANAEAAAMISKLLSGATPADIHPALLPSLVS